MASSLALPASPPPSASAPALASTPAEPSAPPPLPPCPPDAPAPQDALAWISGCAILIAAPIKFEFDKGIIRKESYALLDAVGDILLKQKSFQVEIQAHSDGRREESYGRSLTKTRADSVMKYLIRQKGVDPAQLVAKGYGNSKPIALPDTEEGRQKNRRIEFILLSHKNP